MGTIGQKLVKYMQPNFKTAYVIKRAQDPDQNKNCTLDLSGPYAKIHCIFEKFIFDKVKGADFKYDNISYNFLPKNNLNKTISVLHLNTSVFLRNFALDTAQNYLNKANLAPNLKGFFVLHEILESGKCNGVDFKYDSFFSNSTPKTTK